MGRNKLKDKMKFAIATLIASVSALDFIGCYGADWGDVKGMHRESDCIFRKLSGGEHELRGKVFDEALDKYCHWLKPQATEEQCAMFAESKVRMLVNAFGSDGGMDQEQFYNAYHYVKEMQHNGDYGHADVHHFIKRGHCIQISGPYMEKHWEDIKETRHDNGYKIGDGTCRSAGFDHKDWVRKHSKELHVSMWSHGHAK